MRVKLKNVQPNPFRQIERYPIQRAKVDALLESFEATGFWNNVVARRSPEDDKVQIAYGHHRLAALRERYGENHEIGVIIRDLSDETMLAMMVRENMEEWGANGTVMFETIRSVVQAHADGVITLEPPPPRMRKSEIRYAPSLLPGADHTPPGDRDRPYTIAGLAKFIGWTKPTGVPQSKMFAVMTALELVERGIVPEETFANMPSSAMRTQLPEIRRRFQGKVAAERHRDLARQHEAAAEISQSETTVAEHRRLAEVEHKKAKDAEDGRKPVIDINDYAPGLAARLSKILEEGSDAKVGELKTIIEYIDYLEPAIRDDIIRTLLLVARRATELAEKFQPSITQERRLELVRP